MRCQIILNTTAVTWRPCSQYSDLLWLINPAATTCHWTINHDDLHPHPSSLTLLHLSAHLNMRWRLNGSQKISLWDSAAWQRCLHVREIWLRNTHGCASGCDAHFSPQMEAISRIVYTVCSVARHLVKFESKFERVPVMLMHNVWTASFQISLANKEVRNERFDNVCLLEFDDKNKHWQKISSADNHCPSFLVYPSIILYLDTPYNWTRVNNHPSKKQKAHLTEWLSVNDSKQTEYYWICHGSVPPS